MSIRISRRGVLGVMAGLPLALRSAGVRAAEAPFGLRHGLNAEGLVTLKAAIGAYREADLVQGDAIAARLNDPLARMILEWVALRNVPEKAGLERIAAFLTANPTWPVLALIRRKGEDALRTEKRDDETVLAFVGKDRPLTAVGRVLLARALKGRGQMAEAVKLAASVWQDDSVPDEIEAMIVAEFGDRLGMQDHRVRLATQLFAENWEAALRVAALIGPGFEAIARARKAVGTRASDAEKLIAAVPEALRKEPAFIHAEAQFYRRADRLERAAAALQRLPKGVSLVKPDEWWTERRVLARRLFDDGQADAALKVIDAHGVPGATNRLDAEFMAGWIALEGLKDGAVAVSYLAEAQRFATAPSSQARVAFWQARALVAAKLPPDEALTRAAVHGLTYYGQLARIWLGRREIGFRPMPVPNGAALGGQVTMSAVLMLSEAGEDEIAAPIMSELALMMPDAPALAALVMVTRWLGSKRFETMVGKLAFQRGIAFDEAMYPVGGLPDVPDFGVERALVHALSRQESSFDPRAISPAGARGLMQLMPATAKETAAKAGFDFQETWLLDDPTYNVKVGTSHLKELLELWGGNYVLAIASYNAGATNVRRWVTAYGDPRLAGTDRVAWIERIPFGETRTYVQKVLENLQIYRARLEGQAEIALDADLARGSE